ncbi:hypothetical protein [Tateyamaria sp.]|uniref:hypothetical protein n=1 Tax=Tateyamaria sp. TaxID=1929288 RepID=UPI00329DA755
MSKGDRNQGTKIVGFIAATLIAALMLVGVYDSGRKHGEAIGEYEANSDTYARHTQDQITQCLTLAEDGTKSECMVQVIEANNEHERAEKDLVAQTEMALWALGMLVVSFLMLFVTGLGAWWVRSTLIETKNAVKAANDAVEVTRDIGNRQIRPYVYCSAIRWKAPLKPMISALKS